MSAQTIASFDKNGTLREFQIVCNVQQLLIDSFAKFVGQGIRNPEYNAFFTTILQFEVRFCPLTAIDVSGTREHINVLVVVCIFGANAVQTLIVW